MDQLYTSTFRPRARCLDVVRPYRYQADLVASYEELYLSFLRTVLIGMKVQLRQEGVIAGRDEYTRILSG
jgi:hypothetical protein